MRHARSPRNRFETIGVALTTALALAAVPAAVVSTGSAALAADAAPTTLLSTDFSDGTLGGWTQSGGPTLSYVDVDGNPALQVANRTEDFDGIQTPAGLFADVEPGTVLTLSMRARLAADTAGSAGVRLVVKPAYSWVGNTTMTADAWSTVTGTYTVPADADPAALQVYIGTGALDAPYTYLVDDIVITAPPATPTVDTIVSTDFTDGTYSDWAASGGATLSVVDVEGNPALQVANRTAGLRRHPDRARPVRGRGAGHGADAVDARAAGPGHGRLGRGASRREARVLLGGQHHDDGGRVEHGDRHVHRAGRRRPRDAAGLHRHGRARRPVHVPGRRPHDHGPGRW